LLLDVVAAFSSRSTESWAALWSDRAGALDLGSDAREWWAGIDTLLSLFDAQGDMRVGIAFHDAEVAAFQEGTVGWACTPRPRSITGARCHSVSP
jgi:hypothetical protein